MRSFVIAGIGRGAVRTCLRAFSIDGATGLVVRRTRRRAFSSDGATGLVAGSTSGEQWGEQGVQCTVYSVQRTAPSTTWTTLLRSLLIGHYYIVEVLLVRGFVIASIDACR